MRHGSVSKAILLAGGRGSAVLPLTSFWPKLAFPIGHDPLLAHQLAFLEEQGVREVAIVSSEHRDTSRSTVLRSAPVPSSTLKVHWYFDAGTHGTAGAIRRLADFVGDSNFLVLQANVYIHSLNLDEIVAQHKARGSGLTIVVERRARDRTELEHIELDRHGRVLQFEVPHYSRVNDHPLAFSGLYLFHPRVLDTYDEEGYIDIKEQLLPLLRAARIPVHAVEADGILKRINTLEDYFRLNSEYLLNGVSKPGPYFTPLRETLPGVWLGPDARVSRHAYLVGPVIIGAASTVADGAEIIGPATLGPGTHVESGARVRESIVWGAARVQSGAQQEYSLVTHGTTVPPRTHVRNTVLVDGQRIRGQFSFTVGRPLQSFTAVLPGGARAGRTSAARGARRLQRITKRGLDVFAAALALVILSPLLFAIALAIRLTSRGPVVYSQVRCGLEGREFRMHKFRTMIQDAERLQDDLSRRKETDGPMFKLARDPRITLVGRFLRKTSLDELPQLYNVLRGEMSLVGPRPLAIHEMRCSPSWRDIRLSVLPGITGLWQVEGRSSPRFHDWIEHDVHYVLNHSLMLDLRILWKTLWVAVTGGK